MTDEHVKGAVNTTTGKVKEGIGKLTGDHELETKGKVKQVQGKLQGRLGDVQDRLQKPR